MIDFYVVFWTVMIFTSVFWYAFLLFYVGVKAGKEIQVLTRDLEARNRNEADKKP